MSLFVEPIWSWPMVVLIGIGLVALTWTTYRRRTRQLAPFTRWTLLTLRLLTVLVLIFAMLRPSVRLSSNDKNTATLLVLRDTSRSLTTADGPGGMSRWDAINKTLRDNQSQFDALKKEIEVRFFDFARELKPADEAATKPEGEQTAIGSSLEALLRETQNRRTVGVLMLSDGAQRAVAPNDADPRSIARRYAESQVPISTVGFGASSITGATLDLAVEDLLVDPLVFEKKAVPVTAKLRLFGAAGRKVTVHLLIEDRTGKRPGEPGELKPAPLTQNAKPVIEVETKENAATIPVELSFVPQQPGELKIALEAVPLGEELLTRNNRLETLLTVRRGGLNVAYFDSPRAEAKFVKMVNGSEKIQLDAQIIRPGRFREQTLIDQSWFEPGRYDVYIIGDVPADVFGPELLRQLAARVQDGAGLLMTGGFHAFSLGGYASTPLADLLPVEMNPAESQPGDMVSDEQQLTQDIRLVPTDLGLSQFVLRLSSDPEQNRNRWAALPALEGANILRPKEFAPVQIWARSPEGAPLLLATEVGRARVAAFAGDTTYLWPLAGNAEEHQRFWRQMILWLARKEEDTDQPVWARVEPRNFPPSAPATIAFGARDKDGQPITDAEFKAQVVSPDGQTHPVTPRRTGNEYSAEFTRTEQPGDYWVRVSATRNGTALGFDALTRFIIDARDLELDQPAADPGLLQELATLSGGVFLAPEEVGSFLQRLRERKYPDLTQIRTISLWDNWSLLLAFVTLMTAEWAFRKKRGLV